MRLALCLLLLLPAAFARPNILYIFADDIGYEALGSYGGLDFQTPRLDRMAADGLRFSRAYTSPVCTPSRVSMHTSRYVSRHGHSGVLPVHFGTKRIVDFQKMPTFAQFMRAQGYATSTTGKWQLATHEVWPNHIRDSGFDSWCIWQIWRQGKKTLRHWTPTLNHDGKVRDDIADRFGPDVITDYVIEQMKTATAAKQPFLIVHNELLPHDPIIQTPTERTSGKPASLGGMISYMDLLVGRLLDAVDELGIRDNTYVIFMGDNGTNAPDFRNPKAGEPGELRNTRHTTAGRVNGGKRDLNDAGTHVPLLVWGPPAIPKGAVCDDLIDIVDIFPTFCELSNTDVPKTLAIDGHSFAAQIHGQPAQVTRQWVRHAAYNSDSIFDGQWRYFVSGGQLWDARKLPAEAPADLNDPEAQAAKSRLAAILTPPAYPGVITIDDEQASVTGEWKVSPRAGIVGRSYRHDLNEGKGQKTLTFTAALPKAGVYELRLAYSHMDNRADKVPITITHAKGTTIVHINQRRRPPIDGKYISLGRFQFADSATVAISTTNTNGHVIADGLLILPETP